MKYLLWILWVLIGAYMNFNFGFFNMMLYFIGSLLYAFYQFLKGKKNMYRENYDSTHQTKMDIGGLGQ